jgi:hypothetical protein
MHMYQPAYGLDEPVSSRNPGARESENSRACCTYCIEIEQSKDQHIRVVSGSGGLYLLVGADGRKRRRRELRSPFDG